MSVNKPGIHCCRVKTYRKARGWTLQRVAYMTGLSVGCIYQVEAGGETTLTTMRKLAKALEATISELWPESET